MWINDEPGTPCVRNTFALALGHRVAESSRRADPLSLVLARMDNYDEINTRFGMDAGQEVLEALGKFFIASVRAMDWVARFDVTTFAFLFPNTPLAGALCAAERLRANTPSAGLSLDAAPLRLTLSLGATGFVPGDSSEAILGRAEEAMREAQRSGGNCVRSKAGLAVEAARVRGDETGYITLGQSDTW